MSKEKIRRELLERYLCTGRIGFTKPKTDDEAIDLIETVVRLYEDDEKEQTMTLTEMSNKLKKLLDF